MEATSRQRFDESLETIVRVIGETPNPSSGLSTMGLVLAAVAIMAAIAAICAFKVAITRTVRGPDDVEVHGTYVLGVLLAGAAMMMGTVAYISRDARGTPHVNAVAQRFADSEECRIVEETISAGIPAIARKDLSDIQYACGGRVVSRAIAASGGNITVVP